MDLTNSLPHSPVNTNDWIVRFARLGLVAKGIVYCLIGVLAFMAAFEIGGNSEQSAGKEGVFSLILRQPFGQVLLALVTVGLICYTLWRLIQALLDTEQEGTKPKGIARRIGYASSGIVYGALAIYGIKLLLGSGQSQQGDSRKMLARELLTQPYGQWLVGIVAIATIGFGIYLIYQALSGKYMKKVQTSQIKPELKDVLIKGGKVGYIARGLVWLIVGYLFLRAAIEANAQEAGDSTRAFAFIENTSHGSYLLGAIAIGLICYGVFMFIRAKFEVISTKQGLTSA